MSESPLLVPSGHSLHLLKQLRHRPAPPPLSGRPRQDHLRPPLPAAPVSRRAPNTPAPTLTLGDSPRSFIPPIAIPPPKSNLLNYHSPP
jgi:hypothetical protein